jgi:hypothetical protein
MKYVEGVDYTVEDGKFVWTAEFLIKRGFCCEAGCRNCPYKPLIDQPEPSNMEKPNLKAI